MADSRFGISTHLFHDHLLTRDHLEAVAAHGFTTIELVATRTHFDYRSDVTIDALAGWLSETGLRVNSLHAPVGEALRAGKWIGRFSTADTDEARRRAAVAEVELALRVARRIPFDYLITHLGLPEASPPMGTDSRHAARRSVEEIAALAAAVNVRVALEVLPNALASAAALCTLLEDTLEDVDVGVCLDFGHAHLTGDLGDVIETLSGHIWATHLHDNRGRQDDHLVPFAGTIDWDAAMMETQKVGYDGMLMFEVSGAGAPGEALRRAARARERLAGMLVVF